MPEVINLILVFVVGVVASFFGSMVGGGSLLSIPFLIFLGLPPQVAIATDRFGGIGAATTAFFKFWKAKKIVWKYIPLLAVISLAGSLIGANILLSVDPQILQKVAGILLLVLLPFVFFKKNIGVERVATSRLKKVFASVIYFFIQTFTGFFGAGTGPFVFYTLIMGFGLSIIEAVATQILPLLVLSISSIVIFALKGIIDYKIGVILLAGMAMGGYIGAHVAVSKGSAWVKGLFAILVLVAALKLILF